MIAGGEFGVDPAGEFLAAGAEDSCDIVVKKVRVLSSQVLVASDRD